MEKILVDIREENEWIKKHFKNKDFVTVEELLNVIEELDYEISHLEEEKEDIKKYYEDNWKPVSPYEMYGISECDFH